MALMILGSILAVVTLLLAAFAVHLYRKSARLVRSGVQSPGVVVDLVRHPSRGRGQPTTAPVVEYTSRDGRMHRFESSLRSYPPRHTIGQALTVVYPATNEADGTILDFQDLYLGPILLAILALCALLFALVCFWGMTQPA